MTKLYTYVVRHDQGFAPNPFHGFCTLANCKPQIRRGAQPGDWILGSASRAGGGPGHAVFAMRVSETMGFEEYWRDPRFRNKRPSRRSVVGLCGDNIYHRDPTTGEWQQENSLHGPEEIERDTSIDRVLIGDEFIYWGGDGPPVPLFMGEDIRTKRQGHRCRFPADVVQEFIHWIRSMEERGCVGQPGGLPERARQSLGRRVHEETQRSQRPCSGQRRDRRSDSGGSGGKARCGSS